MARFVTLAALAAAGLAAGCIRSLWLRRGGAAPAPPPPASASPFVKGERDDRPGWNGRCGSCFCIPGNGGRDPCPDWDPETDFPGEVIAALRSKVLVNEFQDLQCNPYLAGADACPTSPPQRLVDVDTAVCAFRYLGSRAASAGRGGGSAMQDDLTEYEMHTYPTEQHAAEAGAVVTHTGACGLCSTAQDLAVYMAVPDMTAAGKRCATRALVSSAWGKACYEDLGYTAPCASIWNYDGLWDAKRCFGVCIKNLLLGAPNNGPPPRCELNECLRCDEREAGPLFQQYAGRTRRRSGLTSMIARGCDDFAYIRPTDALRPMDPPETPLPKNPAADKHQTEEPRDRRTPDAATTPKPKDPTTEKIQTEKPYDHAAILGR